MKIHCPGCRGQISVPREELAQKNPKDGKISFKCPKCDGNLSIPFQSVQGERPAPRYKALILVGDDRRRQSCQAAVQALNFGAVVAESVAEAGFKVEYQTHPLVIVDDTFDQGDGGTAFVEFVNRLDIERRRRICVIMVNSHASTGDPMAALRHHVNHMVGEDGLPRLKHVIQDALKGHRQLYRVYNKALDKLEKA